MSRRGGTEEKRTVCLCVAEWSNRTTVLAWAWLRQYFLRKELDEIYIVHTGKKEAWDRGGPLNADLETCLKDWKHYVYNLSGSLKSNIRDFLEEHDIHLVVVGEDFPKQGGFIGSRMLSESTSDWVKTHIGRPFIIIRQDSVVNQHLRISSDDTPMSPSRRYSSGNIVQKGLSPDNAPKRKIAIAYSTQDVGYHMMELARRFVLLPGDEVFAIHCTAAEKYDVYKHTKSFFKHLSTIGLPMSTPSPGHSGDRQEYEQHLGLAAHLLADYDAHLDVGLKGDPKQSVTEFCESEGIDLLIISSRSAGRLRKTMSGGSVSSHLINKAPCPCLVFPLRFLGFTETEEISRSMTMVGEDTMDATELRPDETPLSVEDLRAELRRKDAIIESLQEEIRELKASQM